MTEVISAHSHSTFQSNLLSSPRINELIEKMRLDSQELPQRVYPPQFLGVTDQKKVYYCQRCLNHGRAEPRKNHKNQFQCECPYTNCACNLCILVEKRRKLNSQLHDLESTVGETDEKIADEDETQRQKGERVPNCQKCGQHGRKSRLKGHKRICPYRDCDCPKCQVVSERQRLMADQIKIRRRQRKDTLMNLTREHITTTLNAAAAYQAGQINFPFNNINNINALLYNQLKNGAAASSLLTSPAASSDGSAYSPTNPINPFAPSPDLLKPSLLLPPSPPSPQGILAPVAINPSALNSQNLNSSVITQSPINPSAFSFPLLSNESLLQSILASYKMFETKLEEPMEITNTIIDVCSV